jgi:hypothetical protein
MLPKTFLFALLILADVCTLGARSGAAPLGPDEFSRDIRLLQDLTSAQFRAVVDVHPDGVWGLARVVPNSLSTFQGYKGGDGDAGLAGYLFVDFSVTASSGLQGGFERGTFQCRFRTPLNLRGPQDIPAPLALGQGLAVIHVLQRRNDAPRIDVGEAFGIPDDWSESLRRLWTGVAEGKEIPFTPLDRGQLKDWRELIDGDDPLLGMVALTKVLKARALSPAEIASSHLAKTNGLRQALYTILILQEAHDADVRALVTALQRAIDTAANSEAVRGLALGLMASDHHHAAPVMEDILLGNVADVRAVNALPVGDRISRSLLHRIVGRLGRWPREQTDSYLKMIMLQAGIAIE